jgi:hypothetical protein
VQRTGFRQLDLQLERELFDREPTAHTPAYSSDKKTAERVIRRLRELHPNWSQQIEEDHWGYRISWLCPFPPGSERLVMVGEYRSPMISVAMCRAALTAHRNFESYEERRRARRSEGAPPSDAAAPPRTFARASGILKA